MPSSFRAGERTHCGPEVGIAMAGTHIGLNAACKSVTEAPGHAATGEDESVAID